MKTPGLVIVGNGVTGVTVARHVRKHSNQAITLISGESADHFSRPALMYVFMGDLRFDHTKPYPDDFWGQNRLDRVHDWVESIDTASRHIRLKSGRGLPYSDLVLATGSQPRRTGCPGENLQGVQGFYSIQDLQALELAATSTRQAVIVGGGLIGVEVAEMLQTRGIGVTCLVREPAYWSSVLPREDADLVGREIASHGVSLRYETQLAEILGDAVGQVRAIRTTAGEEIPCQRVVFSIGVAPNVTLARSVGVECDSGALIDAQFRTSVGHIWAGGDCAQHRMPPFGRRPVEQVWYTGQLHGEHIAANILGRNQPYAPGPWFNSAKFFNLEFQTYGQITPRPGAGQVDFLWEDAESRRLLRIRFHQGSGQVIGVNVFGIRHRHLVWERWLKESASINDVMTDLASANFDPEFFHRYEPDMVAAFNSQFPDRHVIQHSTKRLFFRRSRE